MKKMGKRNWINVIRCMVALAMALITMSTSVVPVYAATESQKEVVKQMIIDAFYNMDTSEKSIIKYGLSKAEFLEICKEVRNGEHERLVGSYDHFTQIMFSEFFKYVKYFYIKTSDTEAFNRYERVNETADAILAGVEPEMDDLDKLIYFHDAIVELVTFNSAAGDQVYTLGGALGDKQAVCLGYAKALNLLLKESGIRIDCMISDSENHAWSYVELDGEWYHVDPTWDDTRSAVKGQTSHKFLLRNDKEFMTAGANFHGTDFVPEGECPDSTSDAYTDWFVHDIIGKMAFEDGLWYFVDPQTKDIVCADTDGNNYETVVKYSGKTLAVVDMEDTMLTYTVAGTKTQLDITMDNFENPEMPEEKDEFTEIPEDAPENSFNSGSVMVDFLEDAELCDYTLWGAGRYNDCGAVEAYAGYTSTINRYNVAENAEYTLNMKDTRFLLEIYEYDENNSLMGVQTLETGDCYVAQASVSNVGLSMYMPIWKTISTEEVLHKMRYDLHSVEFQVEEAEVIVPPVESEGGEFEESKEFLPAECEYTSISEVNLCDYSLWREGRYTEEGIEAYQGYCSTTEYYGMQSGTEYALTMKDTRFNLIVFEFDGKHQLIAETTLCSGDTFEVTPQTCHVGLSMYMPVWKDLPFSEVVTKLKYDLHTVEFVTLDLEEEDEATEEPSRDEIIKDEVVEDEVVISDCTWNAVEIAELSDYTLWCAGKYTEDAEIENCVGHCSTVELYKVAAGGTYSLNMKDSRFSLVIFEYDGNSQLVAETTLTSGDTHRMNDATCHVGLSMYMPIWKDLAFEEVAHKMKYGLHTVELTAN